MGMREDVLAAVTVMAAHPTFSDSEVVEHLMEWGFSPMRAEVLSAFVPLGLARAVIRRIPANPPIDLCSLALVPDFEHNREFVIPLHEVPEFVESQELGVETFETGIIPREPFQAASSRSAELCAISRLLDNGGSVDGARCSPPILLRLLCAPGFTDWTNSLTSHFAQWRETAPRTSTSTDTPAE